jgi:hypothetical protein
MAPISCLYAVPYLKMTPIIYLIQNKLIPTSLGTDWTENERFELVFGKTIIFMPKTRSINSGIEFSSKWVKAMPYRGGRAACSEGWGQPSDSVLAL